MIVQPSSTPAVWIEPVSVVPAIVRSSLSVTNDGSSAPESVRRSEASPGSRSVDQLDWFAAFTVVQPLVFQPRPMPSKPILPLT